MFLIRADLMMPTEETLAPIDAHLEELHNSETPSGDRVRPPGDSTRRVEEESQRLGIDVPHPPLDSLNSLAARLGIGGLD